MMVSQKEIIKVLTNQFVHNHDYRVALADRIKAEGIAPPDGMVLVPIQDANEFESWLCREMPAGTVIGRAEWWAKRIARRFIPQAAAPKGVDSVVKQSLTAAPKGVSE